MQTIKVKVVNFELGRLVQLADSERGAGDFVFTASSAGQAARKSCFAATKVAYQLNHFTAPQLLADCFGELLGCLGGA